MARKRSKRKGLKKRARRRTPPKPDIGSMVDHRRAMEKTLSDIGRLLSEHEFSSPEEANAFLQRVIASGGPPSLPARSPLEEAQDLMYRAWDASGRRRVALALQALEISKDCADAYVLLAEETAGSLEEARQLYEQGVKAGERALGEVFEEYEGHFWGVTETRPYMRARLGLAQCLWALDEWEEAVVHYREMLRLNPNDNQGIRHILTDCLLEVGDDEALGEILEQYEGDVTASFLYTRALWTLRREEPGKKADARLKEALAGNRFVPDYLLGKRRLPRRMPEYIILGDRSEAVEYAAGALKAWQETEGALEWLRRSLRR